MNKLLIKRYYQKGLYADANLETFVKAGFITKEEMQEIKEEYHGQNI